MLEAKENITIYQNDKVVIVVKLEEIDLATANDFFDRNHTFIPTLTVRMYNFFLSEISNQVYKQVTQICVFLGPIE